MLGIVFYNKGKIGGAEKRYYNLIIAYSKQSDVFLIANQSILNYWVSLGGFSSAVKVSVICKEDYINTDINNNQEHNTINTIKKYDFRIKKIIPKQIRTSIKSIIELIKLNVNVLKWAKSNSIYTINSIQGSGILTLFAKLSGRFVVFSYVDYMVENGYPFRWIFNQGLRFVIRFSDKIDFLSEMIYIRMKNKGLSVPINKVNISPNSFIDYSEFKPGLLKKPKIVFTGRIEKIKNPLLAIDVAIELKRKNVDFELYIVGKGSLDKEISLIIEEKNLSDQVKVKYTTKVNEILSDALIFLSLQKDNNYPSQALLEAMAAGCIPIATNVGETYKIVNDEFGFLVEESPSEIAEIIIQIFENVNKYLVFGQKARDFALSQFGVDKYLEYYLNLLNK